ncbi:MAG: hypothetical protein JNL69_01425, partial [Bacteroidia bacterium]|nr:hypothetical protein [Bacteroidia bacterium]
MGSNNKHILLISYVFPPYPGIGGRRWAKFAKYLAKNGYTVHVICAKNPFKEVSLFMDDVANNSNIKIYPISGMYPKVLQKQSSFSIFDKLMYRFWKFFLQIIVKGSIYDKAIFWKKKMLKISTEVILENKIENIIVTGAPFRSVFYAADFKRRFAKINLIIDYRDPWV